MIAISIVLPTPKINLPLSLDTNRNLVGRSKLFSLDSGAALFPSVPRMGRLPVKRVSNSEIDVKLGTRARELC